MGLLQSLPGSVREDDLKGYRMFVVRRQVTRSDHRANYIKNPAVQATAGFTG